MQQTSRGKFDRLPRTTARFTSARLDGYGLCCSLPTRPRAQASYPVLVHRHTLLLHASFRPRLATTPLRFANPSPPSGWIRDSHPQTVEHARHTMMTLPSESVSHNWLYFVVVVAVDKWEAAFCFPLIHSLFSSVARRQLAIAAVLRFQSCSNCVGLT